MNSALPEMHHRKERNGFTLVEIMIVVVIIGILATLAMPAFQQVRVNAIATRFSNDIRTFQNAMEVYALEYGTYPADSGPGEAPDDFKAFLPGGFFENPTPIGGEWDLDIEAGAGYTAAVGVGGLTDPNMQVIQKVDDIVDDGNTGSGSFQWVAFGGGRPYWIVEL